MDDDVAAGDKLPKRSKMYGITYIHQNSSFWKRC